VSADPHELHDHQPPARHPLVLVPGAQDFNNSVLRCSQWIIMHDIIPPSGEFTANHDCSNSYKIFPWWRRCMAG
jgi:hypothetical protein